MTLYRATVRPSKPLWTYHTVLPAMLVHDFSSVPGRFNPSVYNPRRL